VKTAAMKTTIRVTVGDWEGEGGEGGNVPMEITIMDMEDKYVKHGTIRSLRYIYSNPFRFLIFPWACLFSFSE
jgi:hypothetical protein